MCAQFSEKMSDSEENGKVCIFCMHGRTSVCTVVVSVKTLLLSVAKIEAKLFIFV